MGDKTKKNKLPATQVRTDKGQVRTGFEIVSSSDEDRTIEIVFTTGQGGTRYDWNSDSYYIEELDITTDSIRETRLKKGLSVIDSHQPYSIDNVFGITEDYTIENGELRGKVRFAQDPQSEIIYQKVKDKILRHVSLGYQVHEYTVATQASPENLQVLRATDWTPTELSFVAVSFEDNNGVRSLDSNELQKRGSTANNLATIINLATTIDGEQRMLTKAQKARLALLQTLQTRTADEESELNSLLALQTLQADEADTQRSAPTQQATQTTTQAPQVDAGVARQADLAVMLRAVDNAGLPVEFATRHFGEGTTVQDFNSAVIAELGRESSKEKVKPVLKSDQRTDEKANIRQGVMDSIAIRSGLTVKDSKHAQDFSGMTLFETAREFLRSQGENVLGMSRQKLASRAFHSTSDFPLLLANVMNKNLLGGYTEIAQTFRDLGHKTTVNDFREKHTIRLGDAPDLMPLNENGEYQNGSFSESGEKYAISTFARKIGFTREMLINDDLSGLTKVPRMFGQAGSRLESDIVWGLLLGYDFINDKAKPTILSDGKTLFHTDHKNMISGADSAISQQALSDLRKLGRKMKTLDGKMMNVTYQNLVVGEDIETETEKLLLGTILAHTTGDTNPFTNKLNFRVEPRLTMVDPVAFYAFSNAMETFEYATLQGEEDMYTEMVTSTDSDGLTLKVRKDFGAGIVDFRGMAKSAGK